MKNKAFRVAAASGIMLFICSGAQFAQVPTWKGKIVKKGEITVVQDPKEPIYRNPILTLKEDFVLGGGKAQGESAFSMAWSIAVDNGGNIYVGDLKQACVKVFDKAGAYLRTIGRRGQGPGEMSGVLSVSVNPNNQELIVSDAHKLIFFDLQGRFKRNIMLRGMATHASLDRQGNVFAWISDIRERRSILRLFSPDMTKILSDIVVDPDLPDRNMYSPRACWILDPQGRLIFGYAKTYEISFYDEHLKVIKKIVREYEPVKVTEADKKIYMKRSLPPGHSGPVKQPCPSVHAAFRSFFLDDQGHFFIQTWERTSDGRQDIYDVYDSEGRFFGRIALNVHPDFINPIPRILRNNKLYAVEVDEEGYEVVKRYSVAWRY
ncbi:MAG: 6-bladed beta-propeller [Candidatus Aminicenantes bacterium]|nr:6-bladed beta-propeller [Candidatus Aminicenantes bacterium]